MNKQINTIKKSLPIKIIQILWNGLLIIAAILAVLYAGYAKLYPEKAPTLFGYRPYVILTNSMVPTIPVGALVIAKAVDETEAIPADTPITFKTELQGKPVFVTHYFRYIETEDGYERYMTQGEGYQEGMYDEFEIRREDIVGTYVTHIPFLGRIALFLQSPAAFTMFAFMGIILMIEHMIKKWIDLKYPEGEEDLLKPKKRVKTKNIKSIKGRYPRGKTPKRRPPGSPPIKRPSTETLKPPKT
ncbi:MAG: hypothetical protein RR614_02580 [Eubacterium sp.]